MMNEVVVDGMPVKIVDIIKRKREWHVELLGGGKAEGRMQQRSLWPTNTHGKAHAMAAPYWSAGIPVRCFKANCREET